MPSVSEYSFDVHVPIRVARAGFTAGRECGPIGYSPLDSELPVLNPSMSA